MGCIVLMVLQQPIVDSTLLKTGMMAFADIDLTISAIGYLEYSSTIPMRYSPMGSGPQKSMLRFCQAPDGIYDM